jgi:hypothetical protein
MATRPITCPTEPNGFKFLRENLVLDSNVSQNPTIILGLSDFNFEVGAFSKVNINLAPETCGFLSQTDIVDDSGFVTFIAFKVIYPESTLDKDRYVTWEYRGETYYMGEIMILSGPNISTADSEEIGWNLSKPGPIYQDGGIRICNPHTDKRVKIEILVCR